MRNLFLLAVLCALGLAGCHRGGASNNAPAPSGGSPSQQLSWDQGNWNQTNWQ